MFYSETLLSKTGPLARVWLSANLERKLSKTHILQSNIETSVGAIVGQDQAPMALRLSGQLLLGVVRIYSRKARYLLEDCNEALMKIKMVAISVPLLRDKFIDMHFVRLFGQGMSIYQLAPLHTPPHNSHFLMSLLSSTFSFPILHLTWVISANCLLTPTPTFRIGKRLPCQMISCWIPLI